MSKEKLKYLKASRLKKEVNKCNYLLLIGERSNGKSYASKELAVSECYKNDKKFIYLRRYELDIKDYLCSRYFINVPVESITDGKYQLIDVYRGEIFLSTVDDNNKVHHDKSIGYCVALSEDERQKSMVFDDVDYLIYEEFISKDGRYLYNEPDRLQNFVSTVFRNRKGHVILVGNTISRMCIYYREWQLDKIKKQELGSVDTYIFKNDNGDDTKVNVFLTDSLNYNSGMFFGNSAKSITKGAYEVSDQPHLPKPIVKYQMIYQFVLSHHDFMYLCQFLKDPEDGVMFWYVQPKTSEIKEKTRVISNQFNPSPYYSRNLRDTITENEKRIFSMFKSNKVCFSDNLTGTEFNYIIKEYL